ncbi:alpha/beta fold hydrolase [Massilia sp. R2A-15]|uniref:alpha/beta hydrolase n=1 Tax=Massilia sp. R2A-15 TaxID=3064278 RepID=UPI002732ABC2|nr:alpha/beta fold hydrolase [Massilia sp. R2A-15]WLI91032.1 alpha/beta fold hydrolase [Massilia sp. R2A-15]
MPTLKPDLLRLVYAALAAFLIASSAQARAATAVVAISLDTPTGQLAGSLVLPAAKGPVPVALIIAGSGPTDRNGNSAMFPGANNSLMLLAQALGEAGFASVRYDKRGLAGSAAAGSQEKDVRFDHFIDDAAAWIAKLKGDPRFSSVTVIGHSEGSLIGMVAARRAGASAFVSLAGAGRPASAVLRAQLATKLGGELAAQSETILSELEQGRTTSAVPASLQVLYRLSVQPYLVSWFRYDPAQSIAALTVPVLIVQGTTDVQVAVSEAELLKKARPQAQLAVIPGMNHVLKMVAPNESPPFPSYFDPALPLAPELTKVLVDFMRINIPR